MQEFDEKKLKVEAVSKYFAPLIGKQLFRFDTAQMKYDSNEWHNWFDLPIRFFFGTDEIISIVWSHFDKLSISNDYSVNFDTSYAEVQWVSNEIQVLQQGLKGTLQSVKLGRGELSLGEQDIEIWSRLLLEFENGWLEVFNNLDENGFDYHYKAPTGDFIECC